MTTVASPAGAGHDEPMQIGLFVTCLGEQFHPRAAEAVVRVLEHLGHEVAFPQAQTCCGQPMYNNGFAAQARALIERMARVFEAYPVVLTPSGSCASMVREHAVELFAGEVPGAVRQLMERTVEFAEFLVREGVDLGELGVTPDGPVTWHAACHLRGIGGMEHTGQLLETVAGLDSRKPDKQHQCCGFGGTFSCTYPQISGGMVRDKVACLAATEAPTWISSDTGCTMNIAGRARRDGVKARFVHLAEFVAEGLGLMPREDTGW